MDAGGAPGDGAAAADGSDGHEPGPQPGLTAATSKAPSKRPCSAYTWGWGSQGQLGFGDTEARASPQAVAALAAKIVGGVAGLQCGSRFTVAVGRTTFAAAAAAAAAAAPNNHHHHPHHHRRRRRQGDC